MRSRDGRGNTPRNHSKKIAYAIAILFALIGDSIFYGVNFADNDKDELSMKLTKTISSLVINFFLIFVFGREPIKDAVELISDPEKRKKITKSDAAKMLVNNTSAAFAGFIYADLTSTLVSYESNPVIYSIIYGAVVVANTPYHYKGTKTVLSRGADKLMRSISSWAIASGIRPLQQYFLTHRLNSDIKQHIKTHLQRSHLARQLAYRQQLNSSENLSAHPLQVRFSDSTDEHPYQKAARFSFQHQSVLHRETPKRILKNSILMPLLTSSIMVALLPFFIDSFGKTPIKLISFIGTFIANTGLVMLMSDEYSDTAATMLSYKQGPALVSKNHLGRSNQAKRLAAASFSLAAIATITVFTVYTTLKIFDDKLASHIESEKLLKVGLVAIWFGTLAFNIYAIASQAFKTLNKRMLAPNGDARHAYMQQAQHADAAMANPLEHKNALAEYFGDTFPTEHKETWENHLRRDGGIKIGDNEFTAIKQEAKSKVAQDILLGLLPAAAAGIALYYIKIYQPVQNINGLDVGLLKYTGFFVMQCSLKIYKCCTQPKPVEPVFEDAHRHLMDDDRGEMANQGDEAMEIDVEIDLEALEVKQKQQTTCIKRQAAQLFGKAIQLLKGASLGIATEITLQVIRNGMSLDISDDTVHTVSGAVGITTAYAFNRSIG